MLIYKQYDQASLDAQYNNRLQVPDYADYLNHWIELSRQAEKKYSHFKDISYGGHPREQLDIYPSPKPNSKTLIYIHGGYWQRLDKSDFQFIAAAFSPYEITTVLITYPMTPEVSIDQIIKSCSAAIDWTYQNISKYNGDPGQIYLAGHSAGGHLVAMMMTEKQFGDISPASVLKGVCAVSGLYNLFPIQLSFVNEVVNMDKEMAMRNSPAFSHPIAQCPLLLAAGMDESDEFIDQAKELYKNWKDKKLPIKLLELPGLNHYSTTEAIADPASLLHQAIRQMMEI